MRKLKLQMQVSLDGYIAGPNGEMDWMTWNWDDQLKDYVTKLTKPVDCIVLGRVLAQGFIDHWAGMATSPENTEAFATKMHETAKIVFSKTIKTHNWQYTTLTDGDLVKEITKLKKKRGKDIIVYGGGTFVSNLIQHNLIDEYHLFINPVAIGHGLPIFSQTTPLTLVKSKEFKCGIVVLQYEPVSK